MIFRKIGSKIDDGALSVSEGLFWRQGRQGIERWRTTFPKHDTGRVAKLKIKIFVNFLGFLRLF